MVQEKEPEIILEIPGVKVEGTFKPMNFYRAWAAILSRKYGMDLTVTIEPSLELIEAGEKGVTDSNGNTRRLVDWEYWQEREAAKQGEKAYETGT